MAGTAGGLYLFREGIFLGIRAPLKVDSARFGLLYGIGGLLPGAPIGGGP